MSMHIRGDEIIELAETYERLCGAPSKAEAVRIALRKAIAAEKAKKPLKDQIAPLQDELAALGPFDPSFDMKAFTDEMWERD